MTLIAQECFAHLDARDPGKLPEFLRGVFNSNTEVEKILRRKAGTPDPVSFMAAEQALSYGHWLTPIPKAATD
ncbi:hypothetical protein [Leisingera sp. NJS204]|uniref:hypothetical protein n=1 Tax=Leisingera sp. NJS204 TaxID=2508307 RepID=UPI00198124CD|nr:hypothetical protein [Leisingera sp. NJS204]